MSESNKVFVGNLSYDCTEDDLHELFGEFGQVDEAVVIKDRDTGRPRGFAFVTFNSEADANSAIGKLHEIDFMGRKLTVRQAENKRSGGYGGGRQGGGGRQSGGGGYGYGDGRQGGGGYGGGRYGGGRRDRNSDDYRNDGGYGGGGGYGQRRSYNDRENY